MRNDTIRHKANRALDCRSGGSFHRAAYLQMIPGRRLSLAMAMLLLPLVAFAADTIRVNIPRVTVTRAGNHSITSGANSVYVPVEFTFAMSADRVADYVVERNDYYPLDARNWPSPYT